MRNALGDAIMAWALSGIILAFGVSGASLLIDLAACTLTALWLAHLLAHTIKATDRGNVATGEVGLSRRAIFVRTLVFAAVVTATPRLTF
jgi:hypothetical protein